MQLYDPFYNIWDTTNGHNLAVKFEKFIKIIYFYLFFQTFAILIACASGLFYFVLLIYLTTKVYINFRTKKSQLPAMNKLRRAFYEVIYYLK